MDRIAFSVWLFLVACLVMLAPAFAAEELKEQDVYGDWLFPENNSVLKFYRCGEHVCGKLAKVADPSRRDVHNPNPALRNRSVVGIVLFTSEYKKGPTTWRGKLYSTLDGSTYEGTLNMLDKNKFVVVGCIFGNLLCDAKTFLRAEPAKVAAKREPGKKPGAEASTALAATSSTEAAPIAKPVREAAVRPQPTRADFDIFLATRGTTTTAVRTTEQREMLFVEFLAWWEKKGAR
jgi:uncharacterized protein (DUF2147 family)